MGVKCFIRSKAWQNLTVKAVNLFKKLMIFALVAVANIADMIIPEANAAFRSMTIMFYATNEALSVIENAIGMGLDVPQKLKELFSHRDE